MKEARIKSISASPRRDLTPADLGLPLNDRGTLNWKQIRSERPEVRDQMIEEAARRVIDAGFQLTNSGLRRIGLNGLRHGIKIYPNGLNGLQEKVGQSQSHFSRGYWNNPEHIEQEVRKYIQSGGVLSRKMPNRGLYQAINKYYPGGLQGIRQSFELDSERKPKGYWTESKIEGEIQAFYKQHGFVSHTLLIQHGRFDLASAVIKHYPGRFSTLRKTLRYKQRINPKGYWTEEKILEEAKSFFEEFGTISQSFLTTSGHGVLLSAIQRRYPGGLKGLKKNLGIESVNNSSRLSSTAAANEWLRNLMKDR